MSREITITSPSGATLKTKNKYVDDDIAIQVDGAENITANNIKSGVSILGVTGNMATVVANPTLVGGESDLTSVEIEGTKYAIPSGTEVTANPTLDGTESDLTGLEVNGVKYAVPQGSSGGGTITLDDIVDSNGNKRFVEGTCTLNNKNGITWTYNKWSLSGTHLMIVICGTVTASSVSITTSALGSIVLPSYIKDKISPNVNNYVTIKTMDFVDSNLAVVDTVKVRMSKFTDLALYWGEAKTITAQYSDFRIQFDLLIDAS